MIVKDKKKSFRLAQQKDMVFPGHDNLRSHATTLPSPSLLLYTTQPMTTTYTSMQAHVQYSTNRHIHAHNHTHLLARICCGEERCDLNSAFQHSTSDNLFSFTGRFELVMYFPFRVGTTRHLSLSISHTHWEFLVPWCTGSTFDKSKTRKKIQKKS